ncbi:MAG: DMT family transporter [Gammaproteobacteria bacterium]|nr:DMT family transporter [Gammaproteobacteria bacterium]NIR83361.1 DMT family transporter [Gammaproteobacteria bacterium]NIR91161.1 DMT family transporter [Gammaproteobacteria bacterium]NIU04528.1 DMT family transporter [Gammaproteobacteria bacterium]NIW87164.1 EamA family transporter [Gammaproteobacteria bacterium]
MERQAQAYFYAALTIVCWSTVASAFKLTLRHLTSEEMLFWSALFSLGALLLIVLVSGRVSELRTWSRRDIGRSAVLGFLNPFLYYLVLFKAYSLLPAQEAQPLNFTWPIVLVLFSIVVLRQPITLKTVTAMLISFAGVLVISTRGDLAGLDLTHPLGVGLALGSTVVWASYWIYGVRDARDPLTRLCLNFAFGFLFVAGYMFALREVRIPDAPGLIGGAYVGLFEMGITFVMWLKALQLSRTTAQVSSLIFLTPFLSLIVIHLVVGEPIFPSTVVGLVLIVTGILLQHYGEWIAQSLGVWAK